MKNVKSKIKNAALATNWNKQALKLLKLKQNKEKIKSNNTKKLK